MTLVIDTRAVADEDRSDAIRAAFALSSLPIRVSFDGPSPSVLLEAWALGLADAVRLTARDFTVEQTARQARANQVEAAAVGVLLTGSGQLRIGDQTVPLRVGEIQLIDLSSPYTCWWSGTSQACSLSVDCGRLGFSPDVVGRVGPRLMASPLYEIVRDHVFRVARDLHRVAADPSGSAVTAATVQLLRALIESCVRDERDCHASTSEALWPLIVAYIETHLTEHDLTPDRIATAHNISLRYLYKLATSRGVRLSEWIIERRLIGAREELEGSNRRTVNAIARRWGFADPGHFSKRFRQEFGMSPREWRTAAFAACVPSLCLIGLLLGGGNFPEKTGAALVGHL